MNPTIQSLKEALKHSPNNIPLLQLLAETLLQHELQDEAEAIWRQLMQLTHDSKPKIGLAQTFYLKANYAACNVILESLIDAGNATVEVLVLYAKALLKEKENGKAIEAYQKALALAPGFRDETLDNALRLRDGLDTTIDEVIDQITDSRFLQKPSIDFSDVGGMDSVKKEIDLKIIKPLQHPELYKAYGKKTGGGILLYGPPGCGKTYLAKATAGQINAKFISIGLSDILDMWMGNSEKNLHEVFELARANTPCVLFIDEIDALGASRTDMKQSSGRHLINQFLLELDGINHNNEGILILGATNTPWNLDPAFRRPGRFDRILFVPPPDQLSREAILQLKLRNKPVGKIDHASVAKKTEHYSGADLEALVDLAIEGKLEAAFENGIPQPIETKDLLAAIQQHKPSTQEWFITARNFALFSNESGIYNPILNYLNIK